VKCDISHNSLYYRYYTIYNLAINNGKIPTTIGSLTEAMRRAPERTRNTTADNRNIIDVGHGYKKPEA